MVTARTVMATTIPRRTEIPLTAQRVIKIETVGTPTAQEIVTEVLTARQITARQITARQITARQRPNVQLGQAETPLTVVQAMEIQAPRVQAVIRAVMVRKQARRINRWAVVCTAVSVA